MSESSGHKSEEPTARRLEDARKEGQIARSRDVSSAALLGAMLLTLWFSSDWVATTLLDMVRQSLTGWQRAVQEPETVLRLAELPVMRVLQISGMVVLIAMAVGILVGIVQTRGLFAPAAISPDAQRINPSDGLKNIFSRRTAIDFLKSLVKIVLLGATMWFLIRATLPALVGFPRLSVPAIGHTSAQLLFRFFGVAVLVLIALALFDHWFQQIEHRRRLRMTREEVKRERRDNDGDPAVRARRRSLAVQAINANDLDKVRRSNVIIQSASGDAAVAIYFAQQGQVWVVAKGAGPLARAIAATASAAKVRVAVDPALLKAVYRSTAVDSEVKGRPAKEIKTRYSGR